MPGGHRDHVIALLNKPNGSRIFVDPSREGFVKATAESFKLMSFTGVNETREMRWHEQQQAGKKRKADSAAAAPTSATITKRAKGARP